MAFRYPNINLSQKKENLVIAIPSRRDSKYILNTTYDCNTFRRNQYCHNFLKPQSCGTNFYNYLTIFIVKILQDLHICMSETGYRSGYVGKGEETLLYNFLYYLTSLLQLK
jgi:hypothetical protein